MWADRLSMLPLSRNGRASARSMPKNCRSQSVRRTVACRSKLLPRVARYLMGVSCWMLGSLLAMVFFTLWMMVA